MFPYHLYFANINTRDYPDFARAEHNLWKPGLILAEHYALNGIRVVLPVSCALSVMYFYLYHVPRLPLAKRPLAKIGHYFYPSAAYSTAVGVLGGLTYGAVRESARFQDNALASTLQQQYQAVEESLRHYEIRRSRAAARVEASLPWYARLLVFLRLARDPVEAQLRRMGLSRKSWQDQVEPNSLLWVFTRSSKIHDALWYRQPASTEDPCGVSKMKEPLQRGEQNEGRVVFSNQSNGITKVDRGARNQEEPSMASTPSPPAKPYFSKLQTDALISRVMQLRASQEEARWTRTGGRFSLYGIATTLVMLNNGSMLYRASMGLGFGVALGAAISAMRLDDIFTHLR